LSETYNETSANSRQKGRERRDARERGERLREREVLTLP
jgi:hypothetical protein